MTNDQQRLLAFILVQTDIIWFPYRFRKNAHRNAAAVIERRQDFESSGLRIVGGGSDSDRKSFERQLAELANLRLITINRSRSKRTGIRLTDFGDDYACEMLSDFSIRDAWPLLRKVARLTGKAKTNGDFVCEDDLSGVEYCGPLPDEMIDLQFDALPLLRRGLLESMGDTQMRIGYRITDKGRQALKSGKPRSMRKPPAYVPELVDEMAAEYHAGLKDRDSWEGQSGHVWIPLGAGSWE